MLGGKQKYQMFSEQVPFGKISLTVFGRTDEVESGVLEAFSPVRPSTAFGIGGAAPNKGAVGMSFRWNDTNLAFVNAHFAADVNFRSSCEKRNADAAQTIRGLRLGPNDISLDLTMSHHHVFIFGDFNYRLKADTKEVLKLLTRSAAKEEWKLNMLDNASNRLSQRSAAEEKDERLCAQEDDPLITSSWVERKYIKNFGAVPEGSCRSLNSKDSQEAGPMSSFLEESKVVISVVGSPDKSLRLSDPNYHGFLDGSEGHSITSISDTPILSNASGLTRGAGMGKSFQDEVEDEEEDEEVEEEETKGLWRWVSDLDELTHARRLGSAFFGYVEQKIEFPPSFKWHRGVDAGDFTKVEVLENSYMTKKKERNGQWGMRQPSYTDRVLSHSFRDMVGRVKAKGYELCTGIKGELLRSMFRRNPKSFLVEF